MDFLPLFTPFPTLLTPRLTLRAFRQTDLQDLYDYASDPEIDRFTPWVHYHTLAEAQADLDDFIAAYERDGLGAWAIEHTADRRVIGLINLSPPHPRHRRTELGFTIGRAYWRQGFASEAARGVIEFALGPMQMVRVEAVCLPENQASARALQKAGMQYEGLLHNYQIWRGEPRHLLMYAATEAEYSLR